ncbi:hypothetical protein PATSB16_13070 [Pandoraea thiooxydans]|nr:hypothetical protein PATSB16_13070 [Pandoraea thiooxydans]
MGVKVVVRMQDACSPSPRPPGMQPHPARSARRRAGSSPAWPLS